MKNIRFPIWFTTIFLFVYAGLSQYEPAYVVMPWLFIASPFLVIWMVYRVLKDGEESTRTFDEYFYDDVDIKPTPSKEESEDPSYFNKEIK